MFMFPDIQMFMFTDIFIIEMKNCREVTGKRNFVSLIMVPPSVNCLENKTKNLLNVIVVKVVTIVRVKANDFILLQRRSAHCI